MDQNNDGEAILVVGTVSVDRLHLADESTHMTVGGAGMYAALAARQAGASVTLLAPEPRVSTALLREVAKRIRWIGPTVESDELPLLEIAHYGNGRAELIAASWGAEAQLTVDQLPEDLSDVAYVHIAALRSAQRQLDFLLACRERGARAISAGTYAKIVQEEPDIVRRIMQEADLFFMNENEANGLFGTVEELKEKPPRFVRDKTIFVTMGEDGACVFEKGDVDSVAGINAKEVDPTGAGDTFCGAALAKLAQGCDAQTAASEGNQAAARMIGFIGPIALMD